MTETENQKNAYKYNIRNSRATEVAHTFEWLIIAFILVLFFRTFILEPYRIPTGSMADTLLGDHFRLRCTQCGYKYNFGFIPERYGLPKDTNLKGMLSPAYSRCPNCGFHQQANPQTPLVNGDRIMVLKCVYQFFQPKRWDVLVFKNPLEPAVNYIKRLIALPGETVEIIDGDIYINNLIVRKPPKVQKEMWMPVYNNDYQPTRPDENLFNGHAWQQPFMNQADSQWTIQENSPAVFRLDSTDDQTHTLTYDTSIGNNFKATYAYGDIGEYQYLPYCSDLMVHFYVQSPQSFGRVGAALGKYETLYKAWVDFAGDMVIAKVSDGNETILAQKEIEVPTPNKSTLLTFTNVDHQLIFQFGNENLTFDLGRSPQDVGTVNNDIQPKAKIFGSGKMTLSHVAIYRDIHYTNVRYSKNYEFARATEGNPLTLMANEFFVLGDNSPDSQDGRLWDQPGIGNNGIFYRKGVVPGEYLVGKALFVYWPGGFRAFQKSRFAIIPNISQMRFIYSGSNKDL